MYCPRCGTEYQPGDRFCSSCGATVKRESRPRAEPSSTRERLLSIVGRTRRARLLTAGSMIAIVVAIVAFVEIPSHNSEPRYDAYARAADTACVQEEERIAALEQATDQPGQVLVLADGLVLIVGEWRAQDPPMFAPRNREQLVSNLDSALLDVEVLAGTMARAAEASNTRRVLTVARQIDVATTQVDGAIVALGLRRCSLLRFGFARSRSTP